MNTRQLFAGMLRSAVQHALDDERYARQLASMLEQNALVLRARHGGEPKWSAGRTTPPPRAAAPAKNDVNKPAGAAAAWTADDWAVEVLKMRRAGWEYPLPPTITRRKEPYA